jgi:hypothetical protein
MMHFSKRLPVENGFSNFYFNLKHTSEGPRFLVSVVDGKRNTHLFYMKKDAGKWMLIEPETSPYWIRMFEKKLSDLIIGFTYQ